MIINSAKIAYLFTKLPHFIDFFLDFIINGKSFFFTGNAVEFLLHLPVFL